MDEVHLGQFVEADYLTGYHRVRAWKPYIGSNFPFEQAREQGDVTPLVQTVKRWWFEADAWRDPHAQRQFLARVDTYRDAGLPPAEQRMSREEIRTQFGV